MKAEVELIKEPRVTMAYDTDKVCPDCGSMFWLVEGPNTTVCIPCKMLAHGADRFTCGRFVVKSYEDHVVAVPFL